MRELLEKMKSMTCFSVHGVSIVICAVAIKYFMNVKGGIERPIHPSTHHSESLEAGVTSACS